MKSRTIVALSTLLMLTGCQKSFVANYNIKNDANNFKIRRKVVALNTRTDETLFSVEGYISIDTDDDGDLNVTIRTGEDEYKLFYAHLSDDRTLQDNDRFSHCSTCNRIYACWDWVLSRNQGMEGMA